MNFKRIMLIDDQALDNYINKKIMEKAEFAEEFLVYTSAEEAIKFLNENHNTPNLLPEIIFLDINMPGMNGWAFLKEYEKLPEAVTSVCPVIMLTSSIDPIDFQRSKTISAVYDYLKKPLNREALSMLTMENIFEKK